ncbi:pseudoazurin [Marinomonas algicola]|uniref:pseudoazurin n=1 Tax=Marinomonas algicola TaxID=2773454 RepID=UPI001EFF20FD|nr:pseudoazurin [Marinomonas algicola]
MKNVILLKPFQCVVFVFAGVFVHSTSAADWEIKMLNFGAKGSMVFEPDFVQAEVGDTVTFIPSNSGHNARSYVVPDGAKSWKTPVDKPYTIALEQEGLHLFYCPPHLMMGMVGMIQVELASNLDKLMAKAPKLRSKVALKPERVDELLRQIHQ